MNTIYAGISALIYGALTLGAMAWIGSTVAPQPVRLTLEYLRFENGHFIQHISVSGREAVNAEWAARIWRNEGDRDIVLCSGGGHFPYNGAASKPMTPSYWTDDDCPELRPGDQALAVWSYRAEDGLIRSISAEITIP